MSKKRVKNGTSNPSDSMIEQLVQIVTQQEERIKTLEQSVAMLVEAMKKLTESTGGSDKSELGKMILASMLQPQGDLTKTAKMLFDIYNQGVKNTLRMLALFTKGKTKDLFKEEEEGGEE